MQACVETRPFNSLTILLVLQVRDLRFSVITRERSISLAFLIIVETAAGIEAIFSTGGVHRDIKPDNLLIKEDMHGNWIMKVNDFGLARLPQGVAASFITTLAGTPGYAAPEVLRGAPPSQAADIFSFGVTIHELFTNVRPLPGSKVLSCPSLLRPLVQRMIDVNPNNRPYITGVRRELVLASEALKGQKQGLMLLGGIAIAAVIAALLSRDQG